MSGDIESGEAKARRPRGKRPAPQKGDPLTPKQALALAWIAAFIAEHRVPPTYREIAAGLGLKSGNAVHWLVQALVTKGAIELFGGRIRLGEVSGCCPGCGRART